MPISQIFSKRINASKPVPGKLLGLSMDARSVGNSVARLNLGKVELIFPRRKAMMMMILTMNVIRPPLGKGLLWISQGDHPKISNL
jgi:hypothetical protein